jgi:hypothetical protein
MKVPESGEVDMGKFFEEQRPLIFGVFAVMNLCFMAGNYLDRYNMQGMSSTDWIGANLVDLPQVLIAPIAGWAKSRKLQWMAACVSLVVTLLSYWEYTDQTF